MNKNDIFKPGKGIEFEGKGIEKDPIIISSPSSVQTGDLGNMATITIPTTDPGVVGEIWLDNGTPKASQG